MLDDEWLCAVEPGTSFTEHLLVGAHYGREVLGRAQFRPCTALPALVLGEWQRGVWKGVVVYHGPQLGRKLQQVK